MMGKADAVIFDFDGVIADTREDVWDSVEYAANAVGGAMDKEFMEDTCGPARGGTVPAY